MNYVNNIQAVAKCFRIYLKIVYNYLKFYEKMLPVNLIANLENLSKCNLAFVFIITFFFTFLPMCLDFPGFSW